jgi:hypothetical protein
VIQNDPSGHSDRLPLVLVRVRKLRSAGRWNKSREGLIRVIATHIQENVAFARLVKAVHSTPYRDSFVTLDDGCGVGCPARARRITASQRQLRDRESQVPKNRQNSESRSLICCPRKDARTIKDDCVARGKFRLWHAPRGLCRITRHLGNGIVSEPQTVLQQPAKSKKHQLQLKNSDRIKVSFHRLPFFKIARVFVRFDHIACTIVNANQSVV